jgi:hypothetical protein
MPASFRAIPPPRPPRRRPPRRQELHRREPGDRLRQRARRRTGTQAASRRGRTSHATAPASGKR